MLFTYQFRAMDSNSDRGFADVTIVAGSLVEAKKDLELLLTTKDRLSLFKKFRVVHTKAYFTGVVFENVEAAIPELHDAN